LVTPKEFAEKIRTNLHPKKATGFDMIRGTILKKLQRKWLVKRTTLINASIRLKHVPASRKLLDVIMLPKPGKNHTDVETYRPIALLPIKSKLFEKLILKRHKLIVEKYQLVPSHQFGFHSKHSAFNQVHRITDVIEHYLSKKVCSAIFLAIAQAFGRVWHDGLLHKFSSIISKQYYQLLNSYLKERKFRIKYEDEYSELKEIRTHVPQGSVLGPVLYLLYVSVLPETLNCTIATFADDTTVVATGNTLDESTTKLQ
jgi:hypothetical protein